MEILMFGCFLYALLFIYCIHKMVNKHQSRSFKIKKKLKYLLIYHDGPIYNEKLFDVRNDVRQ